MSPLVRANLAEPETRTGLATLAQTPRDADRGLVRELRRDRPRRPGLHRPVARGRPAAARQTRGSRTGPSWSGTLELDGRRPPRLAGAGARRVRGCRRRAPRHGHGRRTGAVDVGAAAGHLVLPAHLPRHRARRRPGRVLAALPADQAPDSRHGAARDRRARRAPRGDAARHRRRASSPWTPSTASPWSTRSPASCSTCRSTPSARRSTTCASRAGCARCSSARTSARRQGPGRRQRPRRPRHRGARRGRHPPRPRARHEHDARRERRPACSARSRRCATARPSPTSSRRSARSARRPTCCAPRPTSSPTSCTRSAG